MWGKVNELGCAIRQSAGVVSLWYLLDDEGAEALYGDAAVLAFAECIAHLVEESGEDDLTGGKADATPLAYSLREFIEIYLRLHILWLMLVKMLFQI